MEISLNKAYFAVMQNPGRYGLRKVCDSAECADRASEILYDLDDPDRKKLENDIAKYFPNHK